MGWFSGTRDIEEMYSGTVCCVKQRPVFDDHSEKTPISVSYKRAYGWVQGIGRIDTTDGFSVITVIPTAETETIVETEVTKGVERLEGLSGRGKTEEESLPPLLPNYP